MKTIALIDGDVLVYRVAFAVEQGIDWGEGMHTLHADEGQAREAIDKLVAEILSDLETNDYHMALTCHETVNFRKDFFPQYKENRTTLRKPLVWKFLREHLTEIYGAVTKSNIEADDILGIWATKLWTGKPRRIIVSVDKDMRSIPCSYWNMKKKVMEEIDEATADYNFYWQTLVGDSTDNYPGCQGIGPKKATAILDNAKKQNASLYRAVLLAFKKAGFGEEFALTQARCARILRAEDYDFTTQTPILWRPPNDQTKQNTEQPSGTSS
jgi:DNA polymerase-1